MMQNEDTWRYQPDVSTILLKFSAFRTWSQANLYKYIITIIINIIIIIKFANYLVYIWSSITAENEFSAL